MTTERDDPPYRFVVAGEDEAHLLVVREIMRRALKEDEALSSWIRDLLPDSCWKQETVTRARARWNEQFPRGFGRRPDFGGGPDSSMVRAQLLLWHEEEWPFDVAVIVRDLDREPDRREGARNALKRVRDTHAAEMKPVLLAHPDPEMEAWIVAGFVPRDDTERTRLSEEQKRLGFDPSHNPHRLTSRRQQDPKDAKRVLEALTCGDRGRRDDCLTGELSQWAARGKDAGLADFIEQCTGELVQSVRRLSRVSGGSQKL